MPFESFFIRPSHSAGILAASTDLVVATPATTASTASSAAPSRARCNFSYMIWLLLVFFPRTGFQVNVAAPRTLVRDELPCRPDSITSSEYPASAFRMLTRHTLPEWAGLARHYSVSRAPMIIVRAVRSMAAGLNALSAERLPGSAQEQQPAAVLPAQRASEFRPLDVHVEVEAVVSHPRAEVLREHPRDIGAQVDHLAGIFIDRQREVLRMRVELQLLRQLPGAAQAE